MSKARRIRSARGIKVHSPNDSIKGASKRAEQEFSAASIATSISDRIIDFSERLTPVEVKALTYTFLGSICFGINALIFDNKNLVIAFNTLIAASVAASVWSRKKSERNEVIFYNISEKLNDLLDFTKLRNSCQRALCCKAAEESLEDEAQQSAQPTLTRPAPVNLGISWGDIYSVTAIRTAIRYCALDSLLKETKRYLPLSCVPTTHLSVARLISKYAEEAFKLARHSNDFTKEDSTDRKLLLLSVFKALFIQTTAVGLEVMLDNYLPVKVLGDYGHYAIAGVCASAAAGVYHMGGILVLKCYGAYEVSKQNLMWFATDSVVHALDISSFSGAKSSTSIVVKFGLEIERGALGYVLAALGDGAIAAGKGVGASIASSARI